MLNLPLENGVLNASDDNEKILSLESKLDMACTECDSSA